MSHGNAASTSTDRHHLIMAAIGIAFSFTTLTARHSAAAAWPNPAQNDVVYWVCQVSYYQKTYVSDVIPVSAEEGAGAMDRLYRGFRSFLTAKYKLSPSAGGVTCIPTSSAAQAQGIVDRAVSPPGGAPGVATGWKPGTPSGPAAPPSPGPQPAGTAAAAPVAPAQSAPAPPATTNITVRLVDAVNSTSYQEGKRYRAVVTQAATAGRVHIPASTLAAIVLVQQSPGKFTAQLVSIRLNGQHTPVTSTTVSLDSTTQQVTSTVGGLLSGLGHHGHAGQVSSAVTTAGAHLAIPAGTTLTFSTSVPQPDMPGGGAAQAPHADMTAPSGDEGLPNGELGPDGTVIGGTASGVLTAYSCYAQTVPPGKHRQTSYVTAPFNSAQPQRWITFWFSQYIHQTYNIPADVARFTIECNSLGNKTPAQQQATVDAAITSWKQHDNDVVSINWAPTQTPTPGVSVAQLNPMTGQMTTGGIGSNLPAAGNAGGSAASAQTAQTSPPGYVLCTTNRSSDNKAYASAIFKGRSEEARVIEQAFLTYLATTYGPNVPHNTSCPARQLLADAQSYLFAMKNQAPGNGIKVVETGWTYNGTAPASVSTGSASADSEGSAASGGQYVLCYSETVGSAFYNSATFHIDVPPPPDPKSPHSDNGRSANALNDLKGQFLGFLQKQYGFRPTSAYPAYCVGSPQAGLAESRRQLLHQRFPQLQVIETGWKPGAAPSPAAANVPAAHVNPYSAMGGSYTGTYVCAKGPVDMTLTLALNESSILNGTMTFYLPPGSHTKAYTFSLGGPLNQTSGSFNLRPMKWETAAPPNYVLVGLIGTVNPQTGALTGKVDYPGCSKFEAMKGREH